MHTTCAYAGTVAAFNKVTESDANKVRHYTTQGQDIRLNYITNENGLTAQVKNNKVAASEHVEDRLGHEIEGETIEEDVGSIPMGETICDQCPTGTGSQKARNGLGFHLHASCLDVGPATGKVLEHPFQRRWVVLMFLMSQMRMAHNEVKKGDELIFALTCTT